MANNTLIAEGEKYLMPVFSRIPVTMVKGSGCYIWDADGRKYLDFVSGIAVNALGHANEEVVDAICIQAHRLIHCSNLYWIEKQIELAKLLVENSVGDKVFFANSGAEANEAAIKLARKYGKKKHGPDCYEIITAKMSFHGRTMATISATGQEKVQHGFEPLLPGFKYVPFNDLEALEAAIDNKTCAVLLEPIQGEGGVRMPDKDYHTKVRELCDKKQILLIYDEIQTGIGRTGKLFAYEHFDVEPDIFTLAKALGSGTAIGAMLAKEEVAQAFEPGDHGSTFGGNPLACAAGIKTMEIMIRDNLSAHADDMGVYLKIQLKELKERFTCIKEIRGYGLLIGMELTIPGKDIITSAMKKGLLLNCVAGNVLRFIPPLIVTKTEINLALDILGQALTEAEEKA